MPTCIRRDISFEDMSNVTKDESLDPRSEVAECEGLPGIATLCSEVKLDKTQQSAQRSIGIIESNSCGESRSGRRIMRGECSTWYEVQVQNESTKAIRRSST